MTSFGTLLSAWYDFCLRASGGWQPVGFGQLRAVTSSGSGARRGTGRIQETGLLLLGQRYYDPHAGRLLMPVEIIQKVVFMSRFQFSTFYVRTSAQRRLVGIGCLAWLLGCLLLCGSPV